MAKNKKKAAKATDTKKTKKTFMQWATAGPNAYIVIGIILVFAGFYGIAKPDKFTSDGTLAYITTIVVFFGLGAALVIQGWRIKTGKAEMPKFKFFSNK